MNTIQLRAYQEECLVEVKKHFGYLFAQNLLRRVILCAPTGAGKTVMFSALTQRTLAKSLDAKVLILTDRIELLGQSGGTLEKFGIRYEAITANNRKINQRARCYVGMVETYYNRLNKLIEDQKDLTLIRQHYLLSFNLVIFDEAHKGAFSKVFKLWESIQFNPFTVGATATPLASDSSNPLSNYYKALVNKVQIADLINEGYLSPCVTYSAKIDRSNLRRIRGEYSEESQLATFATRSVYNGLLQRYQEVCDRYNNGFPLKTICFNVNVAHSLEVTQMFNDAGIPCRHVDGMTPLAERESILSGYKSGAFPIVCNVGILNAGFDDPATSCIIMNRATTSVPLWLQSCGRGSRIAPGKDRFVILDMGDNWTELGLWDAERDWESLWNVTRRKSDKEGVVPAKTCNGCGALVPVSSRICKECGYEFPVKEKEFVEASEFVEVTADMLPKEFTPDIIKPLLGKDRASVWGTLPTVELEILGKYRGRHYNWAIHVIRAASTTEEEFRRRLSELAALRKKDESWVARQEFKPLLTYAA